MLYFCSVFYCLFLTHIWKNKNLHLNFASVLARKKKRIHILGLLVSKEYIFWEHQFILAYVKQSICSWVFVIYFAGNSISFISIGHSGNKLAIKCNWKYCNVWNAATTPKAVAMVKCCRFICSDNACRCEYISRILCEGEF